VHARTQNSPADAIRKPAKIAAVFKDLQNPKQYAYQLDLWYLG
jgi:hypothetical protein